MKKDNNQQPAADKKDSVTKGMKKKAGSSAIAAAQQGRSAVDNTRVSSNHDVSGSSGLANTGPVVTYNDEK